MNRSSHSYTRREALGKFAVLLTAGLWPGALRAAAEGFEAGEFAFVAANDFHHDTPSCDAWFARLFRQIAAHDGVEICLGLGDLAHKGQPESIAAVARLAGAAGLRFHATPGNHDNDLEESTAIFERVLPGSLNYRFEHRGWEFVVINSTEGKKWQDVRISAATLAWLDAELPKVDRRRPLILGTHVPLAASTQNCAANAEEVLGRFTAHNLRLVLGGHFHGRTEARRGDCALVTNACCSRVAGNHDGSTTKGYWLCRALATGEVQREFVEFAAAAS